jgi:hypothetical protein
MRRTIYTTPRPDGGTDVVTVGPASRFLHGLRIGVAVFLGLGVIVALVQSNVAGAAILFLLAAIAMPKRRSYLRQRQRVG